MRQSALEEINRLDAAQTKRLKTYTENLSTDREKVLFDDKILAVLEPYLVNSKETKEVLCYLDSIGYSCANYSYTQINTQLERFLENDHTDFRWNKFYRAQKSEMMKEFQSWFLNQVEYRKDDDIRDVLPKKTTHAGFEFIITGDRKKGAYLEKGVLNKYLDRERLAREEGSFNNTILIGTRTQAGGAFDKDKEYAFTGTYKKKTRLVSMVRLWLILAECKFAKPLQFALGKTEWYAGGKDDEKIARRILTNRAKSRYHLTLDYSHYDQSISSWLIRDAFEIMEQAFKHDPFFDKELFDIVREDLVHKYFIDGKGRVRESKKGVCSGSMFTQLVDSIVNKLMIGTYMRSKDLNWSCMIMGDDNLIFTNEELNKDEICSYLSHNFGIEANPAKCSNGNTFEDPEFLSRFWRPSGVWRHKYDLISKIMYPERFRDYKKGADAVLIIYAYILSFPLGMKQLINVEAFMRDYNPTKEKLRYSKKRIYLTGLMEIMIAEKAV